MSRELLDRERLSKGTRRYIRTLKQEGEIELAKAVREQVLSKSKWRNRIDNQLKNKSFPTLDQMEDEPVDAIADWLVIRVGYRSGQITLTEFNDERSRFSQTYDGILDKPEVKFVLMFISEKTQMPED